MSEETENYQRGNSRYPKIEFAISLIIDKKADERKKREKRDKDEELAEIAKKKKQEQIKQQAPIEEEPIESPRTRRLKIRNSWLDKFKEPEPEPIVEEVVPVTIEEVVPVTMPVPAVEPVKVVKIKRKLKKTDTVVKEAKVEEVVKEAKVEEVAAVSAVSAEVKPKRKYTKKKVVETKE